MTSRPKRRDAAKRLAAEQRKGKKAGVLANVTAAHELSIYVGNSAARDVYERADAWAKSPAGTPYGAKKAGTR
jgi:hypothetical protein